MSHILWLATADARGHLMRCQLLVHALRERGHTLEVVTTSRSGQDFLDAFGVGAEMLSEHYRVEFDGAQNMNRLATEWRMFRYLTAPSRLLRDLAWLRERARGVDLVVNDSFHPALLLASRWPRWAALPPIVHVYGKNLRRAMEVNFAGRWPKPLERVYRTFVSGSTERAYARIEHALDAPAHGREAGTRTHQLPPLVAAPRRPRAEVRAGLGVALDEPLGVVYLNPHFRDPLIAAAIETAAAALHLRLHAVGEGFPGRAGWLRWDTDLVDAISAADVFLSAPGMGALGLSMGLGVPFLALLTEQPEQRANADALDARGHPHAGVEVKGEGFESRLRAALIELLHRPSVPREKRPTTGSLGIWVETFERLLRETGGRAAQGGPHSRAA